MAVRGGGIVGRRRRRNNGCLLDIRRGGICREWLDIRGSCICIRGRRAWLGIGDVGGHIEVRQHGRAVVRDDGEGGGGGDLRKRTQWTDK